MTELRELRYAIGLGQREFAALLSIPLETYRPWDSGRRVAATALLQRARDAVVQHRRQHELLPLDQLARELGIHQRTLRAAARIGRLRVQFSIRSVFGRPIRLATRAAGQVFMRAHYRHYGRKGLDVPPLPFVPPDYDKRLKHLRHRLGLTQEALARRIGAANKAVVYQWESRQRRPSPVFWQRVEALSGTRLNVRRAQSLSKGPAPPCESSPSGRTRGTRCPSVNATTDFSRTPSASLL